MQEQVIHYITPAVTPMLPDGRIDFASCERLYHHLLDGGVDGILILGSIGEFFGFSMEQKKELISFAAGVIGKKTRMIVGTTSMIFDEIPELSRYALEQGAEGVMVIPPYYFHFTDESVFEYYDRLAREIGGHLYLYNFPDRTGYEIAPPVVRKLAEKHANIVGIKDTISGVDHTRELIREVKPVRPDFLIYSGFDDNFAHNVLCGGSGCIAGLSNLYPALTSAWAAAAREGRFDRVQQIQQTVDRLMEIYAVGKPFVPFIKEALVMEGIIAYPTATAPMPEASSGQRERLRKIMERFTST